MKKVLIPTKLNAIARETLEASGGYTVVQDEASELSTLVKEHADAYALIVRSEKIAPDVIDEFSALKVIVRAGAGYNTIDTKYARSKGIDVMNTPGANANAVAEEVVALMLADARHVLHADPSARDGKWEKKNFMGREVSEKTLGIVGLGHIGKTVAKRLSGFDMEVLGYDPVLSEERAGELDIELVDLPELFSRSDYISLHIPENGETKGLVGEKLLGCVKEGATLINCARAGIINEDELRKAKLQKGLRFLNDVYAKDEAGEKSVADIADIMLPHLGASTYEANWNAARRAADQLIEFDEKGITSYIVNRDIPVGLDEAYADLAYTITKLCWQIASRDGQLKRIETSFYGSLKPFADWLLVPIASAINKNFDRSMDFKAARSCLQDWGVDYKDRETDERKGFENSITVDLSASLDASTSRMSTVRGTVAEGTLMITRINDFHQLYFDPRGYAAFFIYKDRPGVLGRIAASLAEAGINIDDVRNPHDSTCEESIAILKVNEMVPDDVVQKIAEDIEARTAFCAAF